MHNKSQLYKLLDCNRTKICLEDNTAKPPLPGGKQPKATNKKQQWHNVYYIFPLKKIDCMCEMYQVHYMPIGDEICVPLSVHQSNVYNLIIMKGAQPIPFAKGTRLY